MKIELKESNYPTFPQADDIYKVLGYCNLVSQNKLSDYFDRFVLWEYSNRQAQYYIDAARFLGLYDLLENKLTQLGEILFILGKDSLLLGVSVLVLRDPIFNDFFRYENVDKTKMKLMEKYNLSENTAQRRTQTIKSWINWVRIVLNNEEVII